MKNPFKSQKKVQPSFLELLQRLLNQTKESPSIKVGEIFGILSGKGYATLLIIFSLPFCTPLQIPGFSTPFGILLAFLGLRIAFAKRLWWPKWILEKEIPSHVMEKIVKMTIKAVTAVQKILRPRLQVLAKNPLLHRVHGLFVCVLAIFLSLPLPIPMTNLLTAFPILLIGLGLLEDDGIVILMAYLFVLLWVSVLAGLFFWGKAHLAAYLAKKL